jgi:hypothetical protein
MDRFELCSFCRKPYRGSNCVRRKRDAHPEKFARLLAIEAAYKEPRRVVTPEAEPEIKDIRDVFEVSRLVLVN